MMEEEFVSEPEWVTRDADPPMINKSVVDRAVAMRMRDGCTWATIVRVCRPTKEEADEIRSRCTFGSFGYVAPVALPELTWPPMSKAEFIRSVLEAGNLPLSAATPNGIKHGAFERIALECDDNWRGEHKHFLPREGMQPCKGWVMIPRPAPAKGYRGGDYSVTTHAEPSKQETKTTKPTGTTHEFWKR